MVNLYKKAMLVMLMGISHAVMSQTAPVVVQAESGTRSSGTVLENRTEGGVTYIRTTVPHESPSDAPQTASRVATYTINFPAAGTYDLYVRHRVGPAGGGADDDSFFYGRGFGTKSPTAAGDWIRVNNNNTVGFTAATDVVTAGGTAATEVWKWLNVTTFAGYETGVSFTVPAGQLTQTFQWGSREDGLDVDKFAFGITGQSYTVAQLDAAVVAGLKKDQQSTFDVYPNPVANGRLLVNSLEKITNVKIIDVKGTVVREFANVNQFSSELNLNVKPGLYIIQVQNGASHTSRKVVFN